MENEIERSSQESLNSLSYQDILFTENHHLSLECEKIWHRIKDLQGGLEHLEFENIARQSEEQVFRVLQQYERRLRAELAYLQETTVNHDSSSNKEVLYIDLQQTQRHQKQDLKETLSHVRAKHSSLVDRIAEEGDMNTALKKIQDALKAKKAAMSQQDSSGKGISSRDTATFTAELMAKVDLLKQANKHFQNGLRDSLSAIPSPPASSRERHRKASKNPLDTTRDFDEDDFMSLSSIIGKLIEKTLNSPEQPYIDITDRMWPQHIEFLLRSMIVLKDPESSTRIKLVPFHL